MRRDSLNLPDSQADALGSRSLACHRGADTFQKTLELSGRRQRSQTYGASVWARRIHFPGVPPHQAGLALRIPWVRCPPSHLSTKSKAMPATCSSTAPWRAQTGIRRKHHCGPPGVQAGAFGLRSLKYRAAGRGRPSTPPEVRCPPSPSPTDGSRDSDDCRALIRRSMVSSGVGLMPNSCAGTGSGLETLPDPRSSPCAASSGGPPCRAGMEAAAPLAAALVPDVSGKGSEMGLWQCAAKGVATRAPSGELRGLPGAPSDTAVLWPDASPAASEAASQYSAFLPEVL